MSRAAFEAWAQDVHLYGKDDLAFDEKCNCFFNYHIHFAWQAWQAARNAAPWEAERAYEQIEGEAEARYRESRTAHDQGRSDGAADCAAAIRAKMGEQ